MRTNLVEAQLRLGVHLRLNASDAIVSRRVALEQLWQHRVASLAVREDGCAEAVWHRCPSICSDTKRLLQADALVLER